jgi:integrase
MRLTKTEVQKMTHKRVTPRLTVQVGQYEFASPELRGAPIGNGTNWTVGVILQHNIEVVLSRHNKSHALRKKKVSYRTMQNRAYDIKQSGWLLIKRGDNPSCALTGKAMRLMLPTNITRKHVLKLTHAWESNPALSVGTVIQKLSTLRIFMRWMGRERVMEQLSSSDMFTNPELIKRSHVATTDKSWSGADVAKIIKAVSKENVHLARQLKLSHVFGMRTKESAMFRPRMDSDPEMKSIHIHRGTKNGKERTVLITTDEQRAVLAEAIASCYGVRGSMMPKHVHLKEWIKHCYYVLNKHGVSRKDGLVPHGLRHGFAHKLYKDQTGSTARVVEGGKANVNPLAHQVALLFVSNQLGHTRASITSVYGI